MRSVPLWFITLFTAASLTTVTAKKVCDSEPDLDPDLRADYGTLRPFYNLAYGLVHAIHGPDLPYESIGELYEWALKTDKSITFNVVYGKIKPILTSETGFVAAIVIGILFMILMPIIGLFFCVCRCCCNNCGGKRYQRDPTTGGCTIWALLTVICFAFLLSGTILYAINNDKVWIKVPKVRTNIEGQIHNLVAFANNSLDQVTCYKDETFSRIEKDVTEVLEKLPERIEKESSGLEDIKKFDTSLTGLTNELIPNLTEVINGTMAGSKDFQAALKTNSDLLATDAKEWLTSSPNSTTTIQKLMENATALSKLSEKELFPTDVETAISDMEKEIKSNFGDLNLDEKIAQAEKALKERANVTETFLKKLKEGQSSADEKMSNYRDEASKIIDQLQVGTAKLNQYLSDEKLAKYYWSYYVGLVLLIPILLVLLFLLLGLGCGLWGFKKDLAPYKRTNASDWGGSCLIAAVICCFIFSLFLMMVTLVVFVGGYAVESYVCEPIFNKEDQRLFNLVEEKIMARQDLVKNISISKVLNACNSDESLLKALNMQHFTKELRNTFMDTISAKIEAPEIKEDDVQVLPPEMQEKLEKSLKNLPDLSDTLTKVQTAQNGLQQITDTIDFIVNGLEELSGTDPDLKNLKDHKTGMSKVQTDSKTLSAQFSDLQSQVSQTEAGLEELHTSASSFLTAASNATAYAKKLNEIISETTSDVKAQLSTSVDWLISQINEKLAKCRPLYRVFKNAEVIVCEQVLGPIQGLWLALGWCLFWFIPTIVIATKLAKYFHKMNQKYYTEEGIYKGNTDGSIVDAFNMPTIKLPRVKPTAPQSQNGFY